MRGMKGMGVAGIAVLSLAVLWVPGSVMSAERFQLSDTQLDGITAGSAGSADTGELLIFDVVRRTQSGRTIAADGSLKIIDSLDGLAASNMLVLDRAQNNLHSIININAVNSVVNVLLNLNISIDSHIGNLNQTNLNGQRPGLPPMTGR